MKRDAFILLLAALCTGCTYKSQSQLPDLRFLMDCGKQPPARLAKGVEKFLQDQGFRTLDLANIQGEHGIHIYDLRISALDQKHRVVEVTSLTGSYHVDLYSPPPTRHDVNLEKDLQNLATETLKCRTYQVTIGDNDESVKDFHEDNVKRIENLFRESAELSESAAQQGAQLGRLRRRFA